MNDGILQPTDLEAEYLELYRTGSPPGVSTGRANLDLLYTVKLRQLTIVTGIPGSGKTEWLDALI